ncbi:MAG: LysM peptidoglycan-binding domain-containing protein [Pseudomonadota bacterium]|uniref:LysM peptidoglycan-binding domain-containing protein n=1 Tax=Gallaecimonas pentaromativorans TaxID=584787 RepID=UPI00067EB8FA|nr:LysM peptidoglycan-binding domain-containing protein [Gallaecimonas pentaromativorans]MED5523157.1 LysM peptidoglycan-binding domain-containing protein [Pseudomonadota bacterium]
MKKILLALVTAAITWLAFADDLQLKNDFPESYVVKKGDTLWDISAKYLKNPWLWPKLWQSNEQVDNPHLIYPGDKLSLVIIDGVPQLVRKPMVKLSPTVRVVDKKDAIPTLPTAYIRNFLTHQQIIDEDLLAGAPRVTGGADLTRRLTSNMEMYARGDNLVNGRLYGVYRKGNHYIDPETKEDLGTEAVLVSVVKTEDIQKVQIGDAEDGKTFDLASLKVVQVEREISPGDYLLPLDDHELPVYFQPHAPGALVDARIIDSSRKTRALGKFDVVVLNKGARDGIDPGMVLDARRDGATVLMKDKVEYKEDASVFDRWFSSNKPSEVTVVQPSEAIGHMMVFRTFDKLSLALILKAEKPIREMDTATNPE